MLAGTHIAVLFHLLQVTNKNLQAASKIITGFKCFIL
jgi:hypothetical protein